MSIINTFDLCENYLKGSLFSLFAFNNKEYLRLKFEVTVSR